MDTQHGIKIPPEILIGGYVMVQIGIQYLEQQYVSSIYIIHPLWEKNCKSLIIPLSWVGFVILKKNSFGASKEMNIMEENLVCNSTRYDYYYDRKRTEDLQDELFRLCFDWER